MPEANDPKSNSKTLSVAGMIAILALVLGFSGGMAYLASFINPGRGPAPKLHEQAEPSPRAAPPASGSSSESTLPVAPGTVSGDASATVTLQRSLTIHAVWKDGSRPADGVEIAVREGAASPARRESDWQFAEGDAFFRDRSGGIVSGTTSAAGIAEIRLPAAWKQFRVLARREGAGVDFEGPWVKVEPER